MRRCEFSLKEAREIVRAAQTIIAGTLPECDTIETSTFELLPDRIHFAASGLMQMGRRFAAPGWL